MRSEGRGGWEPNTETSGPVKPVTLRAGAPAPTSFNSGADYEVSPCRQVPGGALGRWAKQGDAERSGSCLSRTRLALKLSVSTAVTRPSQRRIAANREVSACPKSRGSGGVRAVRGLWEGEPRQTVSSCTRDTGQG